MNKPNPTQYISLQEASKLCSYSQEYLSLRARQGKLKAVKMGRNWVTSHQWLNEYINSTQYISLQAAAEICPYSQEYLSLRARQKKLKAIKLRGKWVTTQKWLDAYVREVGKETKVEISRRVISRRGIFVKFDRMKLEEALEWLIGHPIDKGLAFIDRLVRIGHFNLLTPLEKIFLTGLRAISKINWGFRQFCQPRFAISAVLIVILLISSIFVFNPGARAEFGRVLSELETKIANFSSQLSSGATDIAFQLSSGVLTLVRDSSVYLSSIDQKFGSGIQTLSIQTPQLIESTTQFIEELPSRFGSSLKRGFQKGITGVLALDRSAGRFVWALLKMPGKITRVLSLLRSLPEQAQDSIMAAKNLADTLSDIPEKLSDIDQKVGFLIDAGIQGIPKIPQKIVSIYQQTSQKNEQLKSGLKTNIKQIPGQIVSGIQKFDQSAVVIARSVKRSFTSFRTGSAISFFTNIDQKLGSGVQRIAGIPNLLEQGFNRTLDKLDRAAGHLAQRMSEIPDRIQGVLVKKIAGALSLLRDLPEQADVILTPRLMWGKNLAASIFDSLTKQITQLPQTIKNKFSDAYNKLSEFLIPDYLSEQTAVQLPAKTPISQEQEQETVQAVTQTKQITQVKEITQEKVTEVSRVTETIQTADLAKLNQDIGTLSQRITDLGNQISSRIDYTTPSYAPIYVPSSGIQVAGHSLLSTLNVTGSGSIGGSLAVRGNAGFGNTKDTNTTFDVYSDATFYEAVNFDKSVSAGSFSASSLSISGNGSITGTFSAATTTLSYLTVSNNATTTGSHYIGGDLSVLGNASTTGNLTVAGSLTVAGAQTYSGAASFTATSTSPALSVRQNSTGDIVNFKDGATSVFTVADGGPITINASSTSPLISLTGSSTDTHFSFKLAGAGPFLNISDNTDTSKFYIDNQGNVGIGTTTPDATLAVTASAGSITGNELLFQVASTTSDTITNNLVVTADGRVGIGTASPSSMLSVEGSIWINGVFKTNSDGSASSPRYTRNNDGNTGMYFYGGAGDKLGFSTGGVDRIIIDNNGSVGIGTTTPWGTLAVGREPGDSTTPLFNVATTTAAYATSSAFIVTADGNVGIGTAGPDAKLEIDSGTDPGSMFALHLVADGAGSASLLRLENEDASGTDANDWGIFHQDAGEFSIGETYDDTKFWIKPDGNVGIGTTTPDYKLSVAGQIYATSTSNQLILVNDLVNSEYATFSVDNSGDLTIELLTTNATTTFSDNVVISGNLGGSSPLEVVTDLIISANATTTGSLYIGQDLTVAGIFAQSGGAASFATTTITGDFTVQDYGGSNTHLYVENNSGNVGIGTTTPKYLLTLEGTTNDLFQIATTTNQGIFVVDSDGNVGIGTTSPSQKLDVNGNINVSAGSAYMYNGQNAIIASTTANNWFFGGAGNLTMTGSYNIGFGPGALVTQTTGLYNVAIGYNALQNSTNYNSTGIGYQALQNNYGASNTGIGYQALLNGSGNNNTCIGFNAGSGASLGNWTSGSNNIIIGNNIDLPAQGSANMLSIGNLIYATGLTAFGSASNSISTGNVGIGTTTPWAKLSIAQGASDTGPLFTISTSTDGLATTTAFHIANNGNVGIGTAEPGAALEIVGSSGFLLDLKRLASGVGSVLAFSNVDEGDYGYYGTRNSPEYALELVSASGVSTSFGTNGVIDRMFIDTAGNVGIGTTTPDATLAVTASAGSLTGNELLFQVASTTSDTITNNLVVTADGNVGIGTTSPDFLLHVGDNVANQISGQAESLMVSGQLEVDGYAYFDSNLYFTTGELIVWSNAAVRLNDEVPLKFGSDSDFSIGYSDGEDYLQFIDGSTLGADVRMVIDNTGNVGIGTTSPLTKLSVQGTAGQPVMNIASSTGASLLYVSESGNVGIGTAAPGQLLEVYGGNIRLGGGGNYQGKLLFEEDQLDIWSIYYDGNYVSGGTTDDNLHIRSERYNTNYVTFQNDGNVGIGTTTPDYKLSVAGQIYATSTSNQLILVNDLVNSDYATFSVDNSGDLTIELLTTNATTTFSDNVVISGNLGGSSPLEVVTDLIISANATTTGYFVLGTTNPTMNMSAGDLLIGNNATTTGSLYIGQDLTVAGIFAQSGGAASFATTTITGDFTVQDYGGSNTHLYVENNSGNVGIGTAAPNYTLTVQSNFADGTDDYIENNYAGGGWGYSGFMTDGDYLTSYFRQKNLNSDEHLEIRVDGKSGETPYFNIVVETAEIMRITNDGNVGIGTTTPDATLAVTASAGSKTGSELLFQVASTTSDTITNNLVVTADGNVGIGTAAPGRKLQIDSSDSDIQLKLVGTNSQNSGIEFYPTSGDDWKILTNAYGFTIHDLSDNQYRVVVDNSGNVGIGTTSPEAKLELNKTSGAETDIFQISSTTSGDLIVVDHNGNVGIGTAAPASPMGINKFLEIESSMHAGIVLHDSTSGAWEIYANGDDLYSIFNGTAYGWTIDGSTGNVGIGTTNPSTFLLQVAGDIGPNVDNSTNLGTAMQRWKTLYLADGGLTVGYWNETPPNAGVIIAGNVGIGTTTPQTALHIGTASSTNLTNYSDSLMISGELEVGQSAYLGPMEFDTNAGVVSWIDMPVDSGASANTVESYTARIDGTNILTIYAESDGSGGIQNNRVGVNTTTPDAALAVTASAGSLTGNQMLFHVASTTNSTINNVFLVTADGNVGIGTAGPGKRLEVFDNVLSEESIGSGGGIRIAQDGLYVDARFGINFKTYLDQDYGDVEIGVVKEDDSGSERSGFYIATKVGTATDSRPIERLRIDYSGNVGIGTTSPLSTLHIYDSGPKLYLQDSSLTGSEIVFLTGDNDEMGIFGYEDGPEVFYFKNYETELMRIQANGNVGIGTTTPKYLLTLEGTTNDLFQIATTTNQNIFVVDSDGNVGIGTAAPGADLDIYSDASRIKFHRGANYDMSFGMDSSEISALTIKNIGDATTVAYFGYDGEVNFIGGGNVSIGDYGPDAWLEISDNGGGSVDLFMLSSDDNTDGDLFIVKNNGNVGIGTTSPFALLSVHSTSEDNKPLFVVASTTQGVATTTALIVTANGNVGIGTTAPGAKLDVGGTIKVVNGGVQILYSGGLARNSIDFWGDGGVSTDNNGDLYLTPGGTGDVLIDDGNVGIGTTSPKAELHVEGGDEITALRLQETNGTDSVWELRSANQIGTQWNEFGIWGGDEGSESYKFVINNSGNVGIGTTSPVTALNVRDTGEQLRLNYNNDNYTSFAVDSGGDLDITPTGNNVDINGILSVTVQGGGDEIKFGGSSYYRIIGNDDGRINVMSGKDVLIGLDSDNGGTNAAFKVINDVEWPDGTKDPLFIVQETGNVGIGTTSPLTKLSIEGTAGEPVMNIASSTGASLLYVSESGNIGIGTTAPAGGYKLDVLGYVKLYGMWTSWQTYWDGGASIILGEGSTNTQIGSQNNYDIVLYPQGAGDVLIRNGNVGIGTTSPDYTLQVNGTIVPDTDGQLLGVPGLTWTLNTGDIVFANMFRMTEATTTGFLADDVLDVLSINNASNTPLLYLVENGHIGIATTTPTNILTIGQGMGNAIADGWDVYSSEDYKTDITYLEEQDYEDILEEIRGMDLATWRWKDAEDSNESGTVPTVPVGTVPANTNLGIIAEQAPEQVLGSDGKSISLYDYTSFALAGIKALNSEIEEIKALLNITEDEQGNLVLIEEGGEPVIVTKEGGEECQLKVDEDGYVVLEKLKVQELEIVQGGQLTLPEGPDEIVGQGLIATSSDFVIIENSKIATSSKIFISFTSNLAGASWWVCDKVNGESFKVCLSEETNEALTFDYWIVQTRTIVDSAVTETVTVPTEVPVSDSEEDNFVELTPEEQLIPLTPEEGGPIIVEEEIIEEEPLPVEPTEPTEEEVVEEPIEEPEPEEIEEIIDEEIIVEEELIEEPEPVAVVVEEEEE